MGWFVIHAMHEPACAVGASCSLFRLDTCIFQPGVDRKTKGAYAPECMCRQTGAISASVGLSIFAWSV